MSAHCSTSACPQLIDGHGARQPGRRLAQGQRRRRRRPAGRRAQGRPRLAVARRLAEAGAGPAGLGRPADHRVCLRRHADRPGARRRQWRRQPGSCIGRRLAPTTPARRAADVPPSSHPSHTQAALGGPRSRPFTIYDATISYPLLPSTIPYWRARAGGAARAGSTGSKASRTPACGAGTCPCARRCDLSATAAPTPLTVQYTGW